MKHTHSKMVVDRQRWHDSLGGEVEVGKWEGEASTKSGCPPKMWAMIHVRSSQSKRKGKDGTGGSMTEGQREKSFMYTAEFVFQHRAGEKKSVSSHFSISQTLEWEEKKEVCGAADDKGRTVRITCESLSSTADGTRRSTHTCVYSTFSFSKERVIIHH